MCVFWYKKTSGNENFGEKKNQNKTTLLSSWVFFYSNLLRLQKQFILLYFF